MTRHAPISPAVNPAVRRRTRAGRVLLLGMLGLAAVAGCKSTTAANPGDLLGIAGTYNLVLVNAAPLPYNKGSAFIVRGRVIIHSSPTFDLIETDSTANGVSDVSTSGQWNISNNALTLKVDANTFYFGSLSGSQDTLRVQFNSVLETYVR